MIDPAAELAARIIVIIRQISRSPVKLGLFLAAVYAVYSIVILSAAGMLTVATDTHEAPLKAFIEQRGLNLLGDSLSGFFAPATFIIVFITVVLQSQQMRQSVRDMKHQNNIALAVAQANYKFALFDKRLAVYDELNELSMTVVTTGTLDWEAFNRLNKASHAARYIFSDNEQIIEWVDRIAVIGRYIRMEHDRVTYLEKMQDNGTFGQREQDQLTTSREMLQKYEQELSEVYTWEILDEMFMPYLELPSEIVVDGNVVKNA